MKKVARILAVMLACMLLGSMFVGCSKTTAPGGAQSAVDAPAAPAEGETPSEPDTAPAEPEAPAVPLKIGICLPMTGDTAFVGEEMQKIVGYISAEYPDGVAGRPIEFILEDDTGNSEGAVKAVQKLLDIDKVDAMVGPFFTNQILAVKDMLREAKVPTILATSGNPGIFGEGGYVFSIEQTTIVNMAKHAEYINAKGYEDVALFGTYTDAVVMQMEKFAEVWEGKDPVYQDTYTSGIDDFRTMLTAIKAADPDVIWIHTNSEDFKKIVRQMVELGYDFSQIKLQCDGECIQSDVFDEYGQYVDGNLVYSDTDITADPASQGYYDAFMAGYNQMYGKDADLTFVKMYDCIKILLDGVEACGSGGEPLRNWLSQLTDWVGASGFVTFNNDGYSNRSNAIYEYTDGKATKWG